MSDEDSESLPLPVSRSRIHHDDDEDSGSESDNQRPRKLPHQTSDKSPPSIGLEDIPYPVEIKNSVPSLLGGHDDPPDMEIPLPPDSSDNKYSPSQAAAGDMSPVTTTEINNQKKTVAVLGRAQAKKRLQAFSAAKLAASSTTSSTNSLGGVKKISPIKGVSVFSGRSSDSSKQPQLAIATIKEEETKMKEIIAMNNLLSEKLKAVHTITNPEKFGPDKFGPATAIVKPTLMTPTVDTTSRSHDKDNSDSSSARPLLMSNKNSSNPDTLHDPSPTDRIASFSLKKQKNIRKKRASTSSSSSQSKSRSRTPPLNVIRSSRQDKDRRSRSRERDREQRDRDRRGDRRDYDRDLKIKKSKRSRSRSKTRNIERRRSKSPKGGKDKSRRRSRSRSPKRRKRSRSRDRKKASLSPIILSKEIKRVAKSRSTTPKSRSPSQSRERKRSKSRSKSRERKRSRSRDKKSSHRKKSPILLTSTSSSKYKNKEKDREREREREKERERERERKEKEEKREAEKRREREKEEARIAFEKELDKMRNTKMPSDWLEYKKFQYRPDYIRAVWDYSMVDKEEASLNKDKRSHSRSSSPPTPSRGRLDVHPEPSSLMKSLSQPSKLIKFHSIEMKTGVKKDYPLCCVKTTKQKPPLMYGSNPLSYSGYYKSRDQALKSEDPELVKLMLDFIENSPQKHLPIEVPKTKEWFAASEQVFCPSEGSKSVVISHLYSDEEMDDSPKVQTTASSSSKQSKDEPKPQKKVKEVVVSPVPVIIPSPPPSSSPQPEAYSDNSIDSVPSPLLKRRYDADLPTSSTQLAKVEKIVSKKEEVYVSHLSEEEEVDSVDLSSEEEKKRRKSSKAKKEKKKKKKKYSKKHHRHHSSRGHKKRERSDEEAESHGDSYLGILYAGHGGESDTKSLLLEDHDDGQEHEDRQSSREERRKDKKKKKKKKSKHHRRERSYSIGDSECTTEYSSVDEETSRMNDDLLNILELETDEKTDNSSQIISYLLHNVDTRGLGIEQSEKYDPLEDIDLDVDVSIVKKANDEIDEILDDKKLINCWTTVKVCDPPLVCPEQGAQDLLKTFDDDVLLQLVLDNKDLSAENLLAGLPKTEPESPLTSPMMTTTSSEQELNLISEEKVQEKEERLQQLSPLPRSPIIPPSPLKSKITTEEVVSQNSSTTSKHRITPNNLIEIVTEPIPVVPPQLHVNPGLAGCNFSNLIEIIPAESCESSVPTHDKSPRYSSPPKRRSLDERLELEMGINLRDEVPPPSQYNHLFPPNYPLRLQGQHGMFPPLPDQNTGHPSVLGPQGAIWQKPPPTLPNGYPPIVMTNQPPPYQRKLSQTVQIGDDIEIYPGDVPEKPFTISKHNSKLNPLEVQQLANYEVPTRREDAENADPSEVVQSVTIKIPTVPFTFSFVRPLEPPEQYQHQREVEKTKRRIKRHKKSSSTKKRKHDTESTETESETVKSDKSVSEENLEEIVDPEELQLLKEAISEVPSDPFEEENIAPTEGLETTTTTTTTILETGDIDKIDDDMKEADEHEEDTPMDEPASPIPVYIKKVPALPDVTPGKGILVVAGFRERIFDDKGKSTKGVKFVDGVKPGYGTSRSEGEDMSSPPPASQNKVLLKKRERKKKSKAKTAKREEEKQKQEDEGGTTTTIGNDDATTQSAEDSIDLTSTTSDASNPPIEPPLLTNPPPPPKVPYPYCPLGILYQFNPPYAVLYAQAMAEYGFEITFEPTATIPKSYSKDS